MLNRNIHNITLQIITSTYTTIMPGFKKGLPPIYYLQQITDYIYRNVHLQRRQEYNKY